MSFPPYPGLRYLDLSFSAAATNRFHMCRMLRVQYLPEHSARVCQIFRVLLLEWSQQSPPNNFSRADYDRMELLGLKIGLDHDTVETLTGDVPSHVKTPEIKVMLDQIEQSVLEMIVDHEDYLDHLLNKGDEPWEVVTRKLLKLADIAEGLTFSYYNQGFGHTAPDDKYRWVNDNWTRIAHVYLDALDPELFDADFVAWARAFIVNRKLGITPQHA